MISKISEVENDLPYERNDITEQLQNPEEEDILLLAAAEATAVPELKDAESAKAELTAAEKARIERNRQKALLLRQARLSNQQLHGDLKRNVNCNR